MRISKFLLATAMATTMGGLATSVRAQDATSSPPAPDQTQIQATPNTPPAIGSSQTQAEDEGEGTMIVVTGSRIARPALDSIVPVTSISAADLMSSGDLSVGDALNDLPALRSTYSQSNSTRFIGTSGLNLLDLRGLGTSRTLVLVNNRRHVTSVPGTSQVDTNSIPTDLLERTDIVTGGNSAIYGSDAIAGVVNFVLKQDFQGLRLNAQSGVSTYGDRGQQYISGVWGKNFDEGRGNFAVAGEYSHASDVYYRDRDFETGATSGRNQLNLAEPIAGEPAAGDGVTDYQFYSGVRNGTYSNGGIITAVCNTAALSTNAARCRQNSNASLSTANRGQRYAFDSSGNLVMSNPTTDFRDITAGGSTNTVGGLGSTLYETGQLYPKNDRISLNALAHYDFSDALTVYFEGKYVKIDVNQEGQPSFGTYALRCSNPYVSASSLTTLQSIGYCNTPSTGTFSINRFNVDTGGRAEIQTRETFRFLGGARGTFNDDWKYDFSVGYGEYNAHLKSLNNVVTAKFSNALNAVRNSAGQIVCGINADAISSNDDAACVPINVLGYGSPTSEALSYVTTTSTRKSFSSQFDANASISGDLSQLFTLPGGPIQFAIGAEYRREESYQAYDALTASGATFLNAIQPFTPPALEVKEAFAEVSVPLLRDISFVKELSLTGAVRVSDYNTQAGTVLAYSGGGIYAPIPEIRFRANYAHSVRAPTMSDLYTAQSQNYASVNDPCDTLYVTNGTYRAANCAAAGVPANFVNTVARSQTVSYLSGGNPDLKAETSESYTAGVVLEPKRLIPGLSVTIDYYNITVNNLISNLSAQTILNQCYDSPSGINNQYCALVSRNSDGSFGTYAVLAAGVNFAKQKTSGIDVDYAYAHQFSNGDKLNLSLLTSWVAERTNFVDPSDPNYADRQLSELGDPQWELRASVNYAKGPFSIRYQFQYIGPMTVGTYELQHEFDGRPATNLDAYDKVWYSPYTYHNIRGAVSVNENFQFYAGVDNVFDKLPPYEYGLFGTGSGDSIYDATGRYFYAGIKASF